MKQISIHEWIKNYDNGLYNNKDVLTQCSAGWYDWFCRDTSLAAKTKILASKVKMVAKSNKINVDTMYVFFKNNCPLYGTLYDDFRICDMKTGDVLYTITPSCGHKEIKNKSSVWGRENNFIKPIVDGSWKDVKKYFGV